MNNLQHVVKDNTRFAMHMAVELCEQGDFDSVADAFRWLLQERGDATQDSGKLTPEQVRETIERHFGKVAVLDDGKPVECHIVSKQPL